MGELLDIKRFEINRTYTWQTSSGWVKLGTFTKGYDYGITIIFYEGSLDNPTRYEALIHGDGKTWAFKNGTGLNKIGYIDNTLYVKFKAFINITVFSNSYKPSFERLLTEPEGIIYFN